MQRRGGNTARSERDLAGRPVRDNVDRVVPLPLAQCVGDLLEGAASEIENDTGEAVSRAGHERLEIRDRRIDENDLAAGYAKDVVLAAKGFNIPSDGCHGIPQVL